MVFEAECTKSSNVRSVQGLAGPSVYPRRACLYPDGLLPRFRKSAVGERETKEKKAKKLCEKKPATTAAVNGDAIPASGCVR